MPAPSPPKTIPAVEKPAGATIAEAITAYLATREASQIAPPTLRKYKTFCKQLQAYAESKGYLMLAQFTPGDIDIFYADWKLGARAK